MIQLEGLTQKQMTLCDIMWAIDSKEGVENFIKSLPQADQLDCRTLIELMQLAFLDEVECTDEAEALLKQF